MDEAKSRLRREVLVNYRSLNGHVVSVVSGFFRKVGEPFGVKFPERKLRRRCIEGVYYSSFLTKIIAGGYTFQQWDETEIPPEAIPRLKTLLQRAKKNRTSAEDLAEDVEVFSRQFAEESAFDDSPYTFT